MKTRPSSYPLLPSVDGAGSLLSSTMSPRHTVHSVQCHPAQRKCKLAEVGRIAELAAIILRALTLVNCQFFIHTRTEKKKKKLQESNWQKISDLFGFVLYIALKKDFLEKLHAVLFCLIIKRFIYLSIYFICPLYVSKSHRQTHRQRKTNRNTHIYAQTVDAQAGNHTSGQTYRQIDLS